MSNMLELYLAVMCAAGMILGAIVATLLPFAMVGYLIWRLI